MYLIVTIDTEEDNWGKYSLNRYTTDNIQGIPNLQNLFDEFHVIPTYLITYPVATDQAAASILRGIAKEGKCEIGAHCHPWNTPPLEEDFNEKNSMLCNLPDELQLTKIASLHNKIISNLEIEPVCFRAGRWGFNDNVARNICRLGYMVDTSMTPYMDWKCYQGPDFSNVSPYCRKLSFHDINPGSPPAHLFEIPPTVGFFQKNFSLCNRVYKFINRENIKYTGLIGLFYRLNVLNKVWLSPEKNTGSEMIRLTNRMRANGYPVINMTFHSPSLKQGFSPFVRTKEDEGKFLDRIREFLEYTKKIGVKSIKLSDAVHVL